MAWHATPPISGGISTRQRSLAKGQRGWKAQPGGGSIGFGISPLTGDARAPAHAEVRHRVEQHARIGVLAARRTARGRGDLDDAAEIHHADAGRHVPHHGEVVADEQIGQPEPVLQVAHQVEDLRLHGDVERARSARRRR